jgi:hypothetical protein
MKRDSQILFRIHILFAVHSTLRETTGCSVHTSSLAVVVLKWWFASITCNGCEGNPSGVYLISHWAYHLIVMADPVR